MIYFMTIFNCQNMINDHEIKGKTLVQFQTKKKRKIIKMYIIEVFRY